MAQPVTRVGDHGEGICPLHEIPLPYTTTFTVGATYYTVDGISACIVGSLGVSSCGHQTIALTGSGISNAEGQPIHRIGDIGRIVGTSGSSGIYTVTTGSPNVVSD